MKKFNMIFLGTVFSTIILLTATYFHHQRPSFQKDNMLKSKVEYIKASGKCVECHRRETSTVVHLFEMSLHAKSNLNCLDCHRPVEGQVAVEHKGFKITSQLTSKNCASCHQTEYEQFNRSRHAAPAWAAVRGDLDFSPKQLNHGEKYHPGQVKRGHNKLSLLENLGTVQKGCYGCHSIGKPNKDGSIGSCTECHSRHNPSVAFARKPETCAQCHMGPDHSQFEIYSESKHGTMYSAYKDKLNWTADPKKLTTKDFFIPTCATCHMSGLEGMQVTHDTTERLSLFLYAPVSKKRPHFDRGRDTMKAACLKCHTTNNIEEFYQLADVVVKSTNKTIKEVLAIYDDAKKRGLIDQIPFNEKLDFLVFDIWHYYGRTAKHGAFMGGADYVQWHGNYELLQLMVEIKEEVKKLEENKKKHK